jgi:hypothetical protein
MREVADIDAKAFGAVQAILRLPTTGRIRFRRSRPSLHRIHP